MGCGPAFRGGVRAANVRSPRPRQLVPPRRPRAIDKHQAAAAGGPPPRAPLTLTVLLGPPALRGGSGRRKGVPAPGAAAVQSQPGLSPASRLGRTRLHCSAPPLAPCPPPSTVSEIRAWTVGPTPPGGRRWTKQGPCHLPSPPVPFFCSSSCWEPGGPGDAFGDQTLRGHTTGAPPNPQKSR